MNKNVLAMALLFASVVAVVALALPAAESDVPGAECHPHNPDEVILHVDMPRNENDISSIVAEFEHVKDRVEQLTNDGVRVIVDMERPSNIGPRANVMVKHMMEEIGKRFFEPKRPDFTDMDQKEHPVDEETIPEVHKEDLGSVKPEFVEEVIDFAERNSMHDLAMELRIQLSNNIRNAIRTANIISAADTRANGVEELEEDDRMIVVEEEDDDDMDDPIQNTFFEPKPVAEIPFVDHPARLYLLL